jgi:hypothetical protein
MSITEMDSEICHPAGPGRGAVQFRALRRGRGHRSAMSLSICSGIVRIDSPGTLVYAPAR